MKKRYSRFAALLAALSVCLCLLCLGATAAHAQLRIDFNQPTLAGSNGSTLTFSGLLTNLSNEDIRIDGDSFSLDGEGLTVDDSPFLLNFPETLGAGQSAGGEFFTVMIGPDPPAMPGFYPGTFTIFGEGLTTGQGIESTVGFQVVAAPEPATLALTLCGLILCGGVALGRGHRLTPIFSEEVL